MTGAKKYFVYIIGEDGGQTRIGSTTKTTFTHSKAVVGESYTYVVRANGSKSAYNSAYSEEVFCQAVCAEPALKVSVDVTGAPVLTWKAVTGATGYEIYRAVGDGEFALLTTQSELGYTDADTVVDTKYSYAVRAIAEDPDWGSQVTSAKSVVAACEAPVISASLDGKKPMIQWGEVDGAVKYEIYRSTKKSGGFKKVATVEGESYTDKKASKNKTYYYKVVAVSENAQSAYSEAVKIKSK